VFIRTESQRCSGDGLKRLILPPILSLLLVLAVYVIISRAEPATPLRTLYSGHHFLPPYTDVRDRFGFDSGALDGYNVAQLHAGWYSNWMTSLDPAHPDGLTYAQLIRFHAGADPHDPAQITVKPSREVIAQIAAAHPGSLWLMSNEPDSFYQGDPILPEVYAVVYHDFYTYIKGLDPTALVANGGVVQPTPCRLEYLDIVWDTYQQTYAESMPVDVWNIHAFILREVYNSWGASTPPGVDPSCGIDYPMRDGDNVNVLRNHLIAMRQWMKDKGEQNKPLIITEYGVLWPGWLADEDGRTFSPVRVSHFMTQTFDLFLNETYPDIGYPEDDYRLVQAWAWYSLSDDQHYNGYLFHSEAKTLSPMGQTYADYTAALNEAQYTDLATQLWVDLEPLKCLTVTAPYDALTATLPVTGMVANLGKVPAADVVISSPLLGYEAIQSVPARYEEDVAPLPLPAFTITRPGFYEPVLIADPAQVVADPRRWSNAFTVTVNAQPDLLVLTGAYATIPDHTQIHIQVANAGNWPSPPVSGTLYLSDTKGSLLLPDRRLSIPAIGAGAQVNVVEELALPAPDDDYYLLELEADSDGVLDEQDEGNNRIEALIPIVVMITLHPDSAGALISTSGRLAFEFPAGTVTTSTEVRLTPRLTYELPPGPLMGATAFSLTAYRDGQQVSLSLLRPITVTWKYTDVDIVGLDENALGLYRLMEDGRWERMLCPAQQHQPEVNRLLTCIQQLGDYVFGQGYELYLPVIAASDDGSGLQTYLVGREPAAGVSPGSPLRLPPWAIPPMSR
jgi:hypothetical protein